jgi:hypothetical protein
MLRRRALISLTLLVITSLAAMPLQGCGGGPPPPAAKVDGVSMVSRTSGRYFETYRNGKWGRHFIKGFDIGSSIPNYWPGDLAISAETYSEWFKQIARTNANTILVYTLMMPWFYAALDDYNRANPGRELWLVQQVWPKELPNRFDLFSPNRVDEYRTEIKNVIDALAGSANVPRKKGEAYGKYGVDVLPYTLGILIGREIIYEEARDTNNNHTDRKSFQGQYVKTVGEANAVEVWCAEMADRASGYVRQKYDWQVPVGFISWPTLDPLNHPTEMTLGGVKAKEPDDSQVLDPNKIAEGPSNLAGIFGTFQIYPYYPEFMYREPAYANYKDEFGVLRYGGYLKEFMSIYPDYPAVIGEVGLSTSIGVAHIQPEGLNHGGITEQAQGTGITRLIRAIVKEGYAGSFVFSWQDEWAKKNWVTYPYMVPYDRHVYWHNLMDPEQSFGILAMEPDHVPFHGKKKVWQEKNAGGSSEGIRAIYMDHDAACLYIELQFNSGGAAGLAPGGDPQRELLVGLGTLGPDYGTRRLPAEGLPRLPGGVEFLFRASAGGAKLQVIPDYNKATSRFGAVPSDDPTFEDVTYITNRAQVSLADGTYFPAITIDASILQYGVFMTSSPDYTSTATWYVNSGGSSVRIRLPWTMLNISDPSSLSAILDTRKLPPGPAVIQGKEIGALRTTDTPGINIYTLLTHGGSATDYQPATGKSFSKDVKTYTWKGWEFAPYKGRLKRSYRDIVNLFRELD